MCTVPHDKLCALVANFFDVPLHDKQRGLELAMRRCDLNATNKRAVLPRADDDRQFLRDLLVAHEVSGVITVFGFLGALERVAASCARRGHAGDEAKWVKIIAERHNLILFQQLAWALGQMSTVPLFVKVYNDVVFHFHGVHFTMLDVDGADAEKARFAKHMIVAMQAVLSSQSVHERTKFHASASKLRSSEAEAYALLVSKYFQYE